MNKSILGFLIFGILSFFSIDLYSQSGCDILQVTHPAMANRATNDGHWFGIVELPFMLLSVFFAFATALQLKNGKFAKGMKFLAWGFLVMAVGHLHMQVEQFTGVNLFAKLLGENGGRIIWSVALLATWGFSALGLYYVYRASSPNK